MTPLITSRIYLIGQVLQGLASNPAVFETAKTCSVSFTDYLINYSTHIADTILATEPKTKPSIEIIKAWGKDWYLHEYKSHCPCDENLLVEWLTKSEILGLPPIKLDRSAKELNWSFVYAWRPADSPTKLPPL